MSNRVCCDDALAFLRGLDDNSVDLIFCSPPYEDARTYGIDFRIKGQAWVDWCVERWKECDRVCNGLVAWVVEGKTRKFQWSATPVLLMADLHRSGIKLRKPPAFKRVGIPGSGGPDWLRNDYEFIVCSSKGKLPWSENTSMGHAPKWAPGGEMSHRVSDGTRRNQWGHSGTGRKARKQDGSQDTADRPSHVKRSKAEILSESKGHEPKVSRKLEDGFEPGSRLHIKPTANGERVQCYDPPVKANPGNVIECVVGGGVMGSRLCHLNEAPFPEKLAEFFIRSFCPPNGLVVDPFCGSGTTMAVAERLGRRWMGCDTRQSQVELSLRRIQEVKQ